MDSSEISELVIKYADEFGPTNRPERKEVECQLRGLPHQELFEGLFSIFLMEPNCRSYARQQNAGSILSKLYPKISINLREKVRLCLATWDASVEELPQFLVKRCGKARIQSVIEELEKSALSERERVALDSFKYWI